MKTGGYDSLLSKCILYIFYTYIVKEVYHVYTSKFLQLVTQINQNIQVQRTEEGEVMDSVHLNAKLYLYMYFC